VAGNVSENAFFLPLLNALISALVGLQVFRMLFGRIVAYLACIASIGVCFTTLLLPYSREFFVQPLAALLLLLIVEACLRLRERLSVEQSALLGILLSLLLLNRVDGIVAWPVAGCWFVYCLLRHHSAPFSLWLRSLMIFSVLCATGLAIELTHNWIRSGDLLFLDRRVEKPFVMSPLETVPDLLFNPYRSLLLYAPALLLLLTRPRSWKPSPMTLLALTISLCYGAFYSTYEAYYGGVNPGPRLFLIVYPLLYLPLALQAGREWQSRTYRLAWWTLFAIGLAINAGEAAIDYTQCLSLGGRVAGIFGLGEAASPVVFSPWGLRMIQEGSPAAGALFLLLTLGAGMWLLWRAVRTYKALLTYPANP